MSTPIVADGLPGNTTLRRVTGATLLAGGILACIAAFLPFMRTEWPAIAGDPAGGVTTYLIQPLLTRGDPPVMMAKSALGAGLLLLGAPLGLAALGAATIWARRRAPGRRGFFVAFPLVALGTAYALVNAAISFFPVWDSGIGTRRLEYGAYVMFLGYLLALVGTILLPSIARPPQRD
ncbi:MAG TPA: hypothetical protein VFQ25_04705 [Ktedonobacterales bacterium]|nr:hypothetical protein [Ktedonobacterales bacterium]